MPCYCSALKLLPGGKCKTYSFRRFGNSKFKIGLGMTDIDHPKMAGSGDPHNDAGSENMKDKADSVSKPSDSVTPVKRHKRAHSRNKSISGRQDFIDEIANGNEYKTPTHTPYPPSKR